MIHTYGRMPATKPAGFGARVHFPVLARMDVETGDHRLLDSSGGGTRDMPLSVRNQPAATYGHEGAVPTGTLFEATFDDETGIVSGDGWLLANDDGEYHAMLIATQAQRGNSVDLAEVQARYEENMSEGDDWSYRIRFTKWNIAATTGVGTPAFADARAEIVASMTPELEELIASAVSGDGILIAPEPVEIKLNILDTEMTVEVPPELLASGIVQPYELFFHAEAERPQKIIVDEGGHVYGHLGLWDSTHDGAPGIRIPRPDDGYASFNKPGVLTDRGIVNTGPIFALGGHRPGRGVDDLGKAYGGVENSWADVRITEGKLGPWISGVVRPGVADETVYAARASRISGHWLAGKLKAIVSVNAEGFDVPGHPDDERLDIAASFAFSTQGGVLELVAGFPGDVESFDPREETFTDAQVAELKRRLGLVVEEPSVAADDANADEHQQLTIARAHVLLAELDDES